MTVQERNAEMVDLLSADFQRQYDSVFAQSCFSMYQELVGLRGFWPMSTVSGLGAAMDQSGNSLALGNFNTVSFGYSRIIAWANCVRASSTYLSRGDEAAFDILGTETYINNSCKGLTVGAWVRLSSLPSASMHIASKWNPTGNQRSYALTSSAANRFSMNISSTGADSFNATATVDSVTDKWYFVAGRFVPSTSIDLFVYDTKYSNTTAIPASIFNSTASFNIGASGVPDSYLNAYVSCAFLCCAALPDGLIKALFHKTRAAFVVRSY